MKALNIYELRTFAQDLSSHLEGASLQEILTNDRGLCLGFYREQMHWVLIDLYPPSPLMIQFSGVCPFQKSSPPKPLGLFLTSHAENLFFLSVSVQEEWGRVLVLQLQKGERQCEIEVQLIPKQANVVVRAGGKSISWEKRRPLKPALEVPEVEERSLQQIRSEWLAEQRKPQSIAQDPQVQWEKQRQKDIQKKLKAIGEISAQLALDLSADWQKLGERLKSFGFADLSQEERAWLDLTQSVSWNIENLFRKAKQNAQKRQGTQERLRLLHGEIEKLEKAQFQVKLQAKIQAKKKEDLMTATGARGRKLSLSSGAIAYCGRSAGDNLTLLRKAKAWDYWMHLKDYPGAHAIVHRQKEQVISESELNQVAEWLAKESLSAKSISLGQRLAVVIVESRFVKPIKGDKLGRVTYHSERSFQITLR